eukprot:gnl/MRDRNA2_/MRDRNA2_43208_c0_seq1.p1 gnl/MRDRNA2_/MRDRNA2_43208_c0~~gnl/MRDRNA2_/MRDRNA2_43208_c0_seq1.p1  ORF type:complete len:160 (-),score=20.48 gnl/MRDRNA2_/MRDRNA2_43208_c0_seq1:8-487(-)
MEWTDPRIPVSIRRPWQVFEQSVVEGIDGSNAGTYQQDMQSIKEHGVQKAFTMQPFLTRRSLTDVSFMELAAFACFRTDHLSKFNNGDAECAWDLLNGQTKGEWVPDDARACLLADSLWAPLVSGSAPQRSVAPSGLPGGLASLLRGSQDASTIHGVSF